MIVIFVALLEPIGELNMVERTDDPLSVCQSNDQEVTDIQEKPLGLDVQQQRRRRLLRGLVTAGAGVPVILTLSSGAALAASSSTCLVSQTDVDDDQNGTVRCITSGAAETQMRAITSGAAETQMRANRSAFAGTPSVANGMTGGSDTANDRCLIYHNPTTGAPTNYTTDSTNTWGKNGTNVRINISCWNSFTQ